MKRYLLWFLLVFLGSVFVTSQYQKYAHDSTTPSQNSSNSTVTPSNPPQSTGNTQQPQDYAPRWLRVSYQMFGWPNGITVWALFLTLLTIVKQTQETARAAKATEDAVTASRESLAIQEAEFFQWVDIGEWKVEKDPEIHWVRVDNKIQYTGPLKVRISFPLLNNTARPLSIHSVQILLETGPEKTAQTFSVGENMQVPPKGEYSVVIDTVFTESHVLHYIEFTLFILARVQVRFSNALGKPDGVTFLRLVACRVDEGTRSVSKGHKAEEIDGHKAN
jgi:hypothetical protein